MSSTQRRLGINFTEEVDHRPICPQIVGFAKRQSLGWGSGGPQCPPLEEKEFDCLRLTVTAPAGHKPEQNLPVMVWVHGYRYLSEHTENVAEEWLRVQVHPRLEKVNSRFSAMLTQGCEHLVAMAASLGHPIITVAIQYRLGWLGFLTSKDFEEEAEHYENGLGPGNWGLIDQRNGFLWVKKNIARHLAGIQIISLLLVPLSLGMLISGQSAGSISITYHMCSTVPNLFNRAILQSGLASTLNPLSLETYDKAYRKLLELLGIPLEDSRELRLEKLRQVPVHMFIETYEHTNNRYPSFPGVEGWFWREPIDGANSGIVLAKCKWVDEILIGDCLVEVTLQRSFLNTGENLPDEPSKGSTGSIVCFACVCGNPCPSISRSRCCVGSVFHRQGNSKGKGHCGSDVALGRLALPTGHSRCCSCVCESRKESLLLSLGLS